MNDCCPILEGRLWNSIKKKEIKKKEKANRCQIRENSTTRAAHEGKSCYEESKNSNKGFFFFYVEFTA